jgi:hypothetical protein
MRPCWFDELALSRMLHCERGLASCTGALLRHYVTLKVLVRMLSTYTIASAVVSTGCGLQADDRTSQVHLRRTYEDRRRSKNYQT